MSKKIGWIAVVLSVIAIILGIAALSAAKKPAEKAETEEKDVQYVLYLGTNDKDTNEPVFAPEEAQEEAEKILLEHFGGYTIQEAKGGWKDGDTLFTEYTLVIYLSDTTQKDVYAAADEMVKIFHQSSVLIQANETTTEFYSGE